MKKVPLGISCIVIILFISLTGCEKKLEAIDYTEHLFNLMYGKEITTNYLRNISNGDIEEANKLCINELIKNNNELSSGVSKIVSFQLYKSVEGSNYGYYIYDIIRSSNNEPKAELERYILKVIKNGENYGISEVKSQPQKQLYVKDRTLRIVGKEGVSSKLLISLSSMPNESYLKDNAIMIYKEKVPKENFGEVSIGFTGNKVAISTIGDGDTYICITIIDDSLMSMASVDGIESSSNNIEDSSEKPVAKQLITLDLLNKCIVNEFIFSKDDQNLSVNYLDINGVNRVKVYNTDNGNRISTQFDDNFPSDKYEILSQYFEGNSLIVKVSSIYDEESEIIGEYIVDLDTLEMEKL